MMDEISNIVKQSSFDDFAINDEPPIEEEMSETERIEFIRRHGTDEMKAGLRSVFSGNKYKPKRDRMWENRLHKGKKMVKTIINSNDDIEIEL